MAKNEIDELDLLRGAKVPTPGDDAKARGLDAALRAYDEASEEITASAQGSGAGARLTAGTIRFWREIMRKKLIANPAFAGLVALPVAGIVTWQLLDEYRPAAPQEPAAVENDAPQRQAAETRVSQRAEEEAAGQAPDQSTQDMAAEIAAAPPPPAESRT